jgi:hypothetical protein
VLTSVPAEDFALYFLCPKLGHVRTPKEGITHRIITQRFFVTLSK